MYVCLYIGLSVSMPHCEQNILKKDDRNELKLIFFDAETLRKAFGEKNIHGRVNTCQLRGRFWGEFCTNQNLQHWIANNRLLKQNSLFLYGTLSMESHFCVKLQISL